MKFIICNFLLKSWTIRKVSSRIITNYEFDFFIDSELRVSFIMLRLVNFKRRVTAGSQAIFFLETPFGENLGIFAVILESEKVRVFDNHALIDLSIDFIKDK